MDFFLKLNIMSYFFEISMVILASVYVFIYSSDTLYWLYENEREKLEKQEEKKEEEEMPESVKHMYS